MKSSFRIFITVITLLTITYIPPTSAGKWEKPIRHLLEKGRNINNTHHLPTPVKQDISSAQRHIDDQAAATRRLEAERARKAREAEQARKQSELARKKQQEEARLAEKRQQEKALEQRKLEEQKAREKLQRDRERRLEARRLKRERNAEKKRKERLEKQARTKHSNKSPKTPTGRKGNPIEVTSGTNNHGIVYGREYSGHAFDRMQGNGITPSVVENTLTTGKKSTDPTRRTRNRHYDPINNVTVVSGKETGRVITVINGKR